MTENAEITVTTDLSNKISASCWIAFGICFLSNILGGTVSTLMSVYLPTVVRELLGNVGAERLAEVSAYINALYIIGWAAGGPSWGAISDRIGRTRALALTTAFFGVFTLAVSFATTWEMVVVLRMLSGFGVGGVLVISATMLSEIFPERWRAIFIGIVSIGFPVGIFSAGVVTVLFADWHEGFRIGILPLVVALLAGWGMRESAPWKAGKISANKVKLTLTQEDRNNLIKGALIFGSMLIGLWAIFSWVPTWVQSLLTGSDGQRERGLSMMLLGGGGLIGGFFSGWIANAIGLRKAMMICFAACMTLSFVLFKLNITFSWIIFPEIATLALFFGISQGLLSTYIPSLFPTAIRATATGICFNIGRIFTAAAVFFVGALVIALGGYGNAIFTFSLVFIAGFVLLYFTPAPSIKPNTQTP
jgi:MFS family permease